ncbi:MAG: hypothetical protein LZF86_120016 [Nitrospira sp.]|nr:MAG: hypothetical protein LZF86_120016 [Nitrospira sp.]
MAGQGSAPTQRAREKLDLESIQTWARPFHPPMQVRRHNTVPPSPATPSSSIECPSVHLSWISTTRQ